MNVELPGKGTLQLKIVSDGTPRGTQILNAATGERVKGVRSVSWKVGLDTAAIATIEFVLAPCDVIVETTQLGDEYRSYITTVPFVPPVSEFSKRCAVCGGSNDIRGHCLDCNPQHRPCEETVA